MVANIVLIKIKSHVSLVSGREPGNQYLLPKGKRLGWLSIIATLGKGAKTVFISITIRSFYSGIIFYQNIQIDRKVRPHFPQSTRFTLALTDDIWFPKGFIAFNS